MVCALGFTSGGSALPLKTRLDPVQDGPKEGKAGEWGVEIEADGYVGAFGIGKCELRGCLCFCGDILA